MSYTPQLDRASSALLRRIAWAADRPMTSVLEGIVHHAAESIDREKVCAACRDKSQCLLCLLNARLDSQAHADVGELFRAP